MRRPGQSVIAPAVVGLAAAIVGVIAVGVSLVEVARPASAEVAAVDAVVVHAASARRLAGGLALAEAGLAPVLVVSDVDAGHYSRSPAAMAALCARRDPYEVVCVPPEPFNTLGEARAFGALAEERDWRRVAVVTDRGHLTRAATALRQCTDAEVLPIAHDPAARPPMWRVRDEWLRTAATVTLRRACAPW